MPHLPTSSWAHGDALECIVILSEASHTVTLACNAYEKIISTLIYQKIQFNLAYLTWPVLFSIQMAVQQPSNPPDPSFLSSSRPYTCFTLSPLSAMTFSSLPWRKFRRWEATLIKCKDKNRSKSICCCFLVRIWERLNPPAICAKPDQTEQRH